MLHNERYCSYKLKSSTRDKTFTLTEDYTCFFLILLICFFQGQEKNLQTTKQNCLMATVDASGQVGNQKTIIGSLYYLAAVMHKCTSGCVGYSLLRHPLLN